MVHIPPDPHVLRSMANSNMVWWKALAEFIDNSIDAGATRVVIDTTNRVLTVSDDGYGCEDILAVFRLGDHKRRKSSTRALGRYGVGAKDAWMSCADTMEVQTVRGMVLTTLRVNYDEWANNNWNVPDPECCATDRPTGTTITLPLRRGKNIPSDEAFRALAFAFTPAISRGIQIVRSMNRKREPLQPYEMPIRNDVVQAEFDIDGKQVKIDIGILPDRVVLERGPFWIIYEHRILEANSIGAGNYSVRRLGGTITLGDGWALTKHKDGISENSDRLAAAIFCRVEHVLKKADQLAETIESSALRGELQAMINAAISDANRAKEKRDRGSSIGTRLPKETGRRRTTASQIQPGDGSILMAGKNGRRGGYILDWCELDPSVIGQFDRSGMRVSLNLNNGLVSMAKTQANRAALTACAVSLIADYCSRHDSDGNQLLKFSFHDFPQAMGYLVRDYNERKQDAKSAV